MKRLAMLVCGLLAISLSGCQTNANRPGIFKNGTWEMDAPPTTDTLIDPYVIRLDLTLLTTLVGLEIPILIYAGNPSCSSCQNFKPILSEWIRQTKAAVYYLDTLALLFDLPTFIETYPALFLEDFTTPSLYLIQGNHRLMYARSQSTFYQLSRFKAWIESYLTVIDRYVYHHQGEIILTSET
jgi:hypothetical protein